MTNLCDRIGLIIVKKENTDYCQEGNPFLMSHHVECQLETKQHPTQYHGERNYTPNSGKYFLLRLSCSESINIPN